MPGRSGPQQRGGNLLTGEIKNQIDRIWDSFWSGGISNPLEVIEQITYLLFLRRLDDLHTLEENKAARLGRPIERRVFPEGVDSRGRPYDDLRWSRFKHVAPAEMFEVVDQHVFPFLRELGGDESTYAHHMKDARFTIPTPALLAKVVDLLDDLKRVGDPAGPERVPDAIDLVLNLSGEQVASLLVGVPTDSAPRSSLDAVLGASWDPAMSDRVRLPAEEDEADRRKGHR